MARSMVTLFIEPGVKFEAHDSTFDHNPVVNLDSGDSHLQLFFDSRAQIIRFVDDLVTYLEKGVDKEGA